MKKDRLIIGIILVATVLAFIPIPALDYPPARKGDVVDDYHGTMVPDPYRWMEDPDSEETRAWVKAENELTASFVNTPTREKIKKRYTRLQDYDKYSIPYKKGEYYIFQKQEGLQAQAVMYMQKELGGPAEVILDPNSLSEDGTISLGYYSFSHDGSLLAYGLSGTGSDWENIYVRNILTGEEYPDTIMWTRGVQPAWKIDNSGFYYDRYPDTNTAKAGEATYYNKVYWHTLGTPQSEDRFVFEHPENKELGFATDVTEDGKYLILYVWRGTDPQNGIYYADITDDGEGEIIRLLDDFDAGYRMVENFGTKFFFKTDLDAPNSRIIAIDINNPSRENWETIIPEQKDVLVTAQMINNQFVLKYMQDAHDLIKIYDLDGSFVKEIQMPVIGAVYYISGEREDKEMFIEFASFTYPQTIFRYDFTTDELTTYIKSDVDFDPTGYITRQIFFPSKDGTMIPMFITHKENLVLDGTNPTLLYGYGGFQQSQTPFFSLSRAMWMENGGVFALACTRGGVEYGEQWHQASILGGRQRVYEDFIGAVEWLIANKYTNKSRNVIQGGSGGGLLVASCMVQRPDLFGAVSCEVPLTDMLRYHRLGIGRWWTGEYGNAEENTEHFKFLYAYSPYHNVKEGTVYPATMITTAESDDRVVPAHAKKFAAMLQAKDGGDNPILLRVEPKAGHGAGKPTQKIIEEVADEYAFLFKVFKMNFVDPDAK